ncbi:hypothetical protein EAH_00039640 [Eimeria acervulina]|uniref:Uncharacterized protein n=1 Tax=Eimeria acervulina TaxID=5801 RepID=U6GTN4_EIMAC|nr:hypothetical protein EAH_00039640 [Eimeria acervulina]CDI83505.1 hypothetical protein EAH_00039640 [Eimeria acervulina]
MCSGRERPAVDFVNDSVKAQQKITSIPFVRKTHRQLPVPAEMRLSIEPDYPQLITEDLVSPANALHTWDVERLVASTFSAPPSSSILIAADRTDKTSSTAVASGCASAPYFAAESQYQTGCTEGIGCG